MDGIYDCKKMLPPKKFKDEQAHDDVPGPGREPEDNVKDDFSNEDDRSRRRDRRCSRESQKKRKRRDSSSPTPELKVSHERESSSPSHAPPPKLKGTRYCAAYNCHKNRAANKDMTFFRFPSDSGRCRTWIQNTRRADLQGTTASYCYNNLILCSDHFESQMFLNPKEMNSLVWNATPTLFDVPNKPKLAAAQRRPLARMQKSPSPPPCTDFEDAEMMPKKASPTKKELQVRIKTLQSHVKSKNAALKKLHKKMEESQKVKRLIECIRPYLTEDEHQIVAVQVKLTVGKRKRYTEEFKSFAISIYYKSPACYRFLQTRFKLPSKSAITLWLSKLKFQEGICPNLFKMLKLRVQRLSPEERVSILMCDEISLKRSVDHGRSDDKVFGVTQVSLTREEIAEAITAATDLLDEQGCNYFGGYVLQKCMKLHSSCCSTCVRLGSTISAGTQEIEQREFFTWFKRYDDERSNPYSPSAEFALFIKNVSLLVIYCFDKFLGAPLILKSINKITMNHLTVLTFCSLFVTEKVVLLTVWTVFHYKLKWLNSSLKTAKDSSKRKKKIIMHL